MSETDHSFNSLIKSAISLSKNPIGIIALFLVLFYSIVSLLLGFSSQNLDSYQKWAFIIFIISFPFTILYVFYKLVTKHHLKLYSPKDFRDESNFMKSIPEENRIESKGTEIRIENKEDESNAKNEDRKFNAQDKLKLIDFAFKTLQKEFKDEIQKYMFFHQRTDLRFHGTVIDKKNDILYLIHIEHLTNPKFNYQNYEAIEARFNEVENIFSQKGFSGRQILIFTFLSELRKEDNRKIEADYRSIISTKHNQEFRLISIPEAKIISDKDVDS
ncbi:MAG: hypothetical protein KAR38_03130 [Calditrichia bacterium]|nr:hypothetical protein [Calditrichia bacterium]